MPGWRTRGQTAALETVASAVRTGTVPHALLLVGPQGSGKTTLALDLAAGLLCSAADPAERPCRSCIACRRLDHGNHPDLHRLAPSGPGRQVKIGDRLAPEPGTVRFLIHELALAPAEGRWRVAIVEEADRLNEDAQNALLKLLEEPPAGTVLVLCATYEEALLPTVRSRCTRVRLGRVSRDAIEAMLRGEGLADASRASALAGLADGRPGRARAFAAAPEAQLLHDRLLRELLDLLRSGRAERLAAAAGLLVDAERLEDLLDGTLAASAEVGEAEGPEAGTERPAGPRARGSRRPAGGRAVEGASAVETAAETDPGARAVGSNRDRLAPGARRRALLALADLWRGLARDLAVAARGGRGELAHLDLLEELVAIATDLPPGSAAEFTALLAGIEAAAEQNANPELALDVLLLAWPRAARAA